MEAKNKIAYSFGAIVLGSFIVLALFGYAIKQGQEAHTALCVLRIDLQYRVENGKEFLKTHPNGAFGFTAKAIQINIANQESTLRALDNLGC